MHLTKIKSYAKLNLSLGVLGKLKSKMHRIESLISLINLYDEINIKKFRSKNHKIIFVGKFAKSITKNNTIFNLLKILDKKNYLKKEKYLIKVKKKIPQKSGMGGGSMNASSLLKYFLKKNKLNLSKREVFNIASKIGSDVSIGLQNKPTILFCNGSYRSFSKKFKFYTLLIKPNFGCSTKFIYNNVKKYSRPKLNFKLKRKLSNHLIKNLQNDLEKPAFEKYPVLSNLKKSMEKMDNILFVNMTGSGSTMVGYFNSKKSAINAQKILKKKYNKYWCILSKTI